MMTFALVTSCVAWAFLVWHRRLFSVALLVLLVPIYQIRFTVANIPLTLLELFIWILFAVWLVQIWHKKTSVILPYPKLILFFLFAGTLATLVSVDLRSGLGLWKAYIIEPILVYIVVVNSIATLKHARVLLWALLGLICVISIVGLLQSSGVLPIPEPYASEHPARATSVFAFPTAIGKLLGPLIASALAMVIFARKTIRALGKSFFVASAVAVLFGISACLLSVNRGALLGIGIAGVVVAFFSKKKLCITVVVLVGVVAMLCIPLVRNEIRDVVTGSDTSTDVRLVMWQGTFRLLAHHPIFGAGLGGFPTLYDTYRDASHVELFPNPDNFILTVYVELGIIGCIAFAWLLTVWVRNALATLRTKSVSEEAWLVHLGLFGALVALCVHGLLDTPYFKNDLAVVFWVLFGVVVCVRRIILRESLSK